MSHKNHLMRSIQHHAGSIEEKAREMAEEYAENQSGPGYPRLDDINIDFDRVTDICYANPITTCKLHGDFNVVGEDPVDGDEFNVCSGSITIILKLSHPGGRNFLNIDRIDFEISSDLDDEELRDDP